METVGASKPTSRPVTRRNVMHKEEKKERLGFLAVVAAFGVLLLAIFAMVGLDLVKRI